MMARARKSSSVLQIDKFGVLAQWAIYHSITRSLEVDAISLGGTPTIFKAGEVLVGADEQGVIEECLTQGGEVVPGRPMVPPPSEILRSQQINDAPFPLPVRLRFSKPPRDERPDRILRDVLRNDDGSNPERILASSELSAAVASFVARHARDGRDVTLNLLGTSTALPLLKPLEPANAGAATTTDPAKWDCFAQPTNIVEAWQLVESVRTFRSLKPVVWVAILDSGFWLDPASAPLVDPSESVSDFGLGVPQVNLVNPGTNYGGPNINTCTANAPCPWHANAVASTAIAAVGNGQGAAGSGGTVARPFFFNTDLSYDQTVTCLNYCTWWGIDIVNMSFGKTIIRGLFGDDGVPNFYDKAFRFATDNGVIVIAAAGNDGKKLPDLDIRPATRTPGVITVGALGPRATPTDAFAARTTSNFGPSVDIWAPGSNIPVAPDQTGPNRSFNGTSAAAPLVSGVVAMLRAIAPHLNHDDVLGTLQRTAWKGDLAAGGKVSGGIDAKAAILDVLGGRLPDDLGEKNRSPASAAQLHRDSKGILKPLFDGFGTHNKGETDYWRFDLQDISSVDVKMEWYALLGGLNLHVEATDAANTSVGNLKVTGSSTSGSITLSGVFSPGGYIVRVSGQATTAYSLEVKSKTAVLPPDQFEPNNTFDDAKLIVFEKAALLFLFAKAWGPGTYEASLHRRWIAGIGPLGIDIDFFKLDVPNAGGALGAILISRVSIFDTDQPIDVTLFDEHRQILKQWIAVRTAAVEPPAGSKCFLKIAAKSPTRYKLGIGRWVDPTKLPGEIEQAEVIPEWWVDPPDFVIRDAVTHFAVDINGNEDTGARIAFHATTERLGLELRDLKGRLVRSAKTDDLGQLEIRTDGLAEEIYLLRVTRPATNSFTAESVNLKLAPRYPG